jgi:hypothetical protein
MIIVNLKGGLGNQMFQYAMGKELACLNKDTMKLDLGFLKTVKNQSNLTLRNYELSIFNIREDFATYAEVKRLKNVKTKILSKIFPNYKANPYIKERHFHFDPSICSLTGNHYFDGHWLSEKYFSHVESEIRSEFTFKRKILDEAKSMHSQILNSNSVCIHVRRGDYVYNPTIAKLHQTTSLTYFKKGIALIKSRVKDPVFFVFSDDINWCVENLHSLENAHFIEKELAGKGADNSDYLQLMTACKYFVISNSTFSWWAAWLSTHPDKIVVAPQNWFNDKKIITKDVYPVNWTRI